MIVRVFYRREPFEMKLQGIIPYLVTPYDTSSEQVKLASLEKLSASLIGKGVHGLSPLGSSGEVHYLSQADKISVVQTVVDVANGQVPVVPGITAFALKDTIEQINTLEKIGIDGVVIILNAYFPLSDNQIIKFFKTVARSVSCPIVLYNNPQFTNCDLTTNIIIELAEEPNIQYFKDASGQTGRLLSIMNQVGDQLKIFSASAHIPLHVMQLGGVGWMAGPACAYPEQALKLYDLTMAGQWEAATGLQQTLWRANEAFQRFNLVPCLKALLNMQGYDVGDPIPPLTGLDEREQVELRKMVWDI